MKWGACGVGLLGAVLAGIPAIAADEADHEISEPFVRFEHMIGSWKGTSVPTANPRKGWPETHMWAWKFAKGIPVGMTIELKGDKTLTKGQLSYDEATQRYRLEGTDASGKPVAYAGKFDPASKALMLDRAGASAGGKDRLVLRPNSNKIRYVLEFDHQEPGAPQYKRVISINLGKEGESFAAGGASADLPKCILTGGAATMSVTYQGKSYPICCSGCRDEFNDNPEKYVKKAALMAEQGGGKTPLKSASSKVGKDDGSFEGLVDEESPKAKANTGKSASPAASKATSAKEAPSPSKGAGKASSKAATLLRLGQNLEKSGKTAGALKYYQQIIKDAPGTPQAKTAAARIKALGGE